MNGTLSALIGGGGLPIGASLLALDAPVNFTSGSTEYLRTGSIKPYSAGYAAAIAAAPQLRVFGSDVKTYGVAAGTYMYRYHYVAGTYIAVTPGSTGYNGALNALAGCAVNMPSSCRKVASSSAYLVYGSSFNAPLKYTTTGAVVTDVGGSFATYAVPTAMLFANNQWLALSTLTGTAGEQAYINNANPTGAWTVGASTNIGMTTCAGLAYGNGVFVVVGTSSSATAGKIATTASAGSAWTDRTSASGLTFAADALVVDVVFDGAMFVLTHQYNNTYLLATSSNGITWTAQPFPVDQSSLTPLAGVASWGGAPGAKFELTTDGAGTVVLNSMGAYNSRAIFSISTDHGVTWTTASPYLGKSPIASGSSLRTMSYANGRWIENHSGSPQSCVDIGPSLVTPDYIGNQYQLGAGQFIRIK